MADAKFEDAVAMLEAPEPAHSAATETDTLPVRVTGIVLGRLAALPSAKRALVTLKGQESRAPIAARRIAGLSRGDVGREVALMFEEGDPDRPTIIGLIEPAPRDAVDAVRDASEPLVLDAETILLDGRSEIVLRCGKASITLTRAGKVLIRGAYLLNRSSGVNRIKGGSVQIN